MKFLLLSTLTFLLYQTQALAKTTAYQLTITKGTLNLEGENFENKLFINGSIPGPELVFTEGDLARITVINQTNEPTLIHWHGILLPNDQDGVPLVNSPAIAPGSSKVYEFPIKQTGTYWYHSHVMYQEEDGLFGALKMLPQTNSENLPEKTVIFSDLSHESGYQIHTNLKKDGDYYDLKTDTVQSWLEAFKTGTSSTKFRNSLQRMEGMDYSDVGYDYFTANGKKKLEFNEPVEQIKLRLINGSSTSMFKLTYAGEKITVIAADGLPVEPVDVQILPIAVAETYDVILQVPRNKKLELRATSIDNSGFVSVWFGQGELMNAPDMPWEHPIGMSMGEMMGMPNMGFWREFAMVYKNEYADIPTATTSILKDSYSLPDHSTLMPMMDMGHSMNHNMKFRIMNEAPKNEILKKKGAHYELSYDLLKAKEPIDLLSKKKLRIFNFTLNGNMENYVWTINGEPLGPDTYLKIVKGERVRFVMKNTTMMNHPMHLHGHFFRVMTSQGKWSVLKHTVNVAPLSTTVIEFEASEEKDWFFHCHILYHMMDGMTRMVRYENNPGPQEFEKMREDAPEFNVPDNFYLRNKLIAQTNYARMEGRTFSSFYQFDYDFKGDYEKELEGEINFGRTLTKFFTPFIGVSSEKEESSYKTSPTVGLSWLLPLQIGFEIKYQPLLDKKIEIEFENEIQLTDKLQFNYEFIGTKNFYAELEYRQTKNLSFLASYNESNQKWGGGLGYIY